MNKLPGVMLPIAQRNLGALWCRSPDAEVQESFEIDGKGAANVEAGKNR